MSRLWWLVGLLLAACSVQGAPPATPTPAIGTVSITLPTEGTVYYGDVVTVRGTAQDLPPDGFDLRLLLGHEQAALVRVVPVGGEWSVLVPLHTLGVGILTIQAESIFTDRVYAAVTAVRGNPQERPAGVYGVILFPTAEDVPGGDQIMVRGAVSGVGEGALMLTLRDERGREVQQVRVLVPVLGVLDEVPFQADLVTGNGAGRFTLTLSLDDVVLDEVTFLLGQVAG
ncbi:MAG: hypothetical protein SNJ54_01465 [Anaerolineae bacterium]